MWFEVEKKEVMKKVIHIQKCCIYASFETAYNLVINQNEIKGMTG